jgi:biopolymer transport protein ExbD
MLHFEEAPPRKARIEIIPMIDVMMFLLIFFVLISLNVIPAFGLKTTLPDSKTAQRASSDQPPIMVNLMADGSVALDGQTMPADQLGAAAQSAHQKDPRKRFIVSADQTVQWQGVVSVMDALRAQGIESITFATKRVK